ncbi:MAG: hypothetical protein ACD_30C00040G0003 [uncultured bacterium]|uniref:Uncharacterized protein n=4 Tax=Candidatus Daviesiibacteriota TaxID=1752718 RepID=A0A0G0F2F2_9BACT|nr:MAG: hypothetical protein ACD_30C00040G0003 [uncultured bacterium]KKQ07755.1 MAG: hypothetical protein US19_C0038G0007 [Candidatus Daviesbacteria bacterium GW2011_GWB1_36_5]KKQ15059.1 MAG: hypothetical protein US28_C0024G0016 [Candidatus Daviesbacteria bacterium GW2011_GWA1_36_8]OGE17131.1 MAG: hypothetical protein A2858_00295 [Candidatus Daviesbacteria bacterium RIFCSPHIGHO2_01_FULL_36_37]OGE35912.1 MAG: hypothetical protein A3E66_01290 [Candidatus Daviesbacteria bacterium RIFCSPHIGHO2_12_F
MERIVRFDDPILKAPSPTSFPTYYPRHVTVSDSLMEATERFRGGNTQFLFVYGSSLYKEGQTSGMLDLGVFIDNSRQFHEENLANNSPDYGFPHWLMFHELYNKRGPSFYHTSLNLGGEVKPAKYFSIQFNQALDELNSWKIYLSGRFHKPMIVPLVEPFDPKKKEQLDRGINQSRINAAILALALMEEEFTFRDFAETEAQISYLGDKRGKYEKDNKHVIIVEECWSEFNDMLPPVMEVLEGAGMIEETGNGRFAKKVSLCRQEVENFLERSNKYAKIMNISNALTVGLGRSLNYIKSKEKRAETSKIPESKIA